MDKKTTYYVIAAVVLVAVVGIIVAMNQPSTTVPVPVVNNGNATVHQKAKSEGDIVKDVAKQLNLSAGDLPLRVTMDDNGQTASLTPGKDIVLMLGNNYNWQITSSNEKVLAKKDITLVDAREQAVYQVAGSGNSVLSATGTCKTKTCTPASETFKFTVEGRVSENVPPSDLVK